MKGPSEGLPMVAVEEEHALTDPAG